MRKKRMRVTTLISMKRTMKMLRSTSILLIGILHRDCIILSLKKKTINLKEVTLIKMRMRKSLKKIGSLVN
jgi:hypothetical protein